MERKIFDNYDFSYTEMYNDFVEWCKFNDIDHTQYDDESEFFHNWVWETLNQDWEDFKINLKYDKENKNDYLVVGEIGRWDGRREIQPQRFDTLSKAIMACCGSCDYISIDEENGVINITAIHHDGRNYFSIHKLNKRSWGIDDLNKLEKPYYHTKIQLSF